MLYILVLLILKFVLEFLNGVYILVNVLLHSFVQKWAVILWFGIWVLYFHRMLNITYQVLEVDWSLSAEIDGHMTWVICY